MPEEATKVTRRRAHLTMTVHPDTLVRLDMASSKYALPRGQIVDKLVHALGTCIEQQTLTCVTGEVCRVGRRDVPQVL
jgi:hypothetical protein